MSLTVINKPTILQGLDAPIVNSRFTLNGAFMLLRYNGKGEKRLEKDESRSEVYVFSSIKDTEAQNEIQFGEHAANKCRTRSVHAKLSTS